MYAVIETGGKQYRVAQGDVIKVELLKAEAGSSVEFDHVLLVGKDGESPKLGTPFISGGKVTGTIKGNGRHERLFTFKLRRRKNYRRRAGHRQHFTEVEITGISG